MKHSSSTLIVGAGKSKRLDALRYKTGLNVDKTSFRVSQNNQQQIKNKLSQSSKDALEQARQMIEARMSKILEAYPAGKTNTFFRLKYGVEVNQITILSLGALFGILTLDGTKIRHFEMIQQLNINGGIVAS